jgi:hypothetical protein
MKQYNNNNNAKKDMGEKSMGGYLPTSLIVRLSIYTAHRSVLLVYRTGHKGARGLVPDARLA